MPRRLALAGTDEEWHLNGYAGAARSKELEMFTPDLSILPEPQRQLWAELGDTPKTFVLYGGTALCLAPRAPAIRGLRLFLQQAFQADFSARRASPT